ncbi:DUF2917 domain-containing protein [Variovorax sp. J22R133]|uniref:DUF2917 domain-containing protein n=1 Tax=Variovorax brevis TaxID=3053503 RepID=UPI002577C855|nr:DUF2917 domain-containing protein [Variovorax sp. J22R133]MDM0116573.1 DUF2917 domain-containing protein [Variovorax sp. J22R133]
MNLATCNRVFRSVIPFLAWPGRAPGADDRPTPAVQWVSLPGNGTFDLERPLGCRLQCTRGSIWVTHSGDGRDIVVEAGSSFIGDRKVPMFIQALGAAEFCIDRAEGDAHAPWS